MRDTKPPRTVSPRTFSDRVRLAAQQDFCPRFSGRVRRALYNPLGVLLAAAGAAVLCGLAVHPRVFALAGGLLAVAACGVGWPWVTARGLRVSVGYDRERGVEGGEVGAWAEVTNHLPWPAWGLALGDGVRLPAVPGRSRVRYAWAFAPPARGEYPADAPRLTSGFPFGVWEAGRAAAVASRLVVWPRTFPVGPVPPAGDDAAAEGHSTRGRAGTTGDVAGVRPYRRGDSPRRIHWAQSAKHDRLVVCELQAPVRPAVLVVLDADPAAHTPGPDGSRGWAVRVAASLAKGWLDAGARVGLVCGDEVVAVNAGPAQATRVLDALARLGAGGRPLADVLASPAVRSAQVAVRVVVASDLGAAGVGPAAGVRWAILHADGFPGDAPGPTVAAGRVPRAWLDVPSVEEVAHRLRHGTAEASHGS